MTQAVVGSQRFKTWTQVRARLTDYPEVVVLICFVVLFLIFTFWADNFLSLVSLTNILTIASIKGIFVVGVAMVIISGEFDMSVGSTLAVASYVFALTLESGVSPLLAMLLALGVSALLGLINGLIVTKTGIPSFIATLGTLLAYRGIARALGGGNFASYSGEKPYLFTILNGELEFINRLGTPAGSARLTIAWFILFVIIAFLVMSRTRYGNWVYATGGNRDAALAQGVNTNFVIITNFVITGMLAGFAGLVQFASRPAVDPLRGEGWEFIAVAACVIGGIWLKGGYGTIIGAALGIVLLQMVEQGLILIGVDVQLFQATIGLILISAVIVSTYLSQGN
jgi:simple sugar transport system permease protein